MTLFKLDANEMRVMSEMSGTEAPMEIALCRPCSKLMSNKETAVQLIRGTIIAGFRTSGVSIFRAEAAAAAFCNKLVSATPKSNPS
jgi:hypothetical protein